MKKDRIESVRKKDHEIPREFHDPNEKKLIYQKY